MELVKAKNLDIKVVIGGAVITESFAEEIHADGYSEDAADTVHVNILGAKKITKFVGQYIADNYKLTDYRKTDNSIKKDLCCIDYTAVS